MIQYFDMTKAKGCCGMIPENGETIVFTGVSVNSMPVSIKEEEGEAYCEFASKYGITYIFDDDIPTVDFYTVPRIDIAAFDSLGGYIASVEEPFTFSHPVRLVYISNDRKCYLITNNSTEFMSIVHNWRARLTPYSGVKVYESKDAAKNDYKIIDFEKTAGYLDLMKLIGE